MKLSNRFHLILLVLAILLFALPALAGVNAGGGGSGSANVPVGPFAHYLGYGLITIAAFWKKLSS